MTQPYHGCLALRSSSIHYPSLSVSSTPRDSDATFSTLTIDISVFDAMNTRTLAWFLWPAHPEYTQALRIELEPVIFDDTWTKFAVSQGLKDYIEMPMLDATRGSGILMFSDGTEAPIDTQVAVASKNENIHEDPLEFEPWRFSESGNGRDPSRFFAVTQLEGLVSHVPLNFDGYSQRARCKTLPFGFLLQFFQQDKATKEMQAPIETPTSPTSAAVSEAAINVSMVSLTFEHLDAQLPRLLYPQMLHDDTPDGTPLLSPSNTRSTASDAELLPSPPQPLSLVDVQLFQPITIGDFAQVWRESLTDSQGTVVSIVSKTYSQHDFEAMNKETRAYRLLSRH
ncbi:hypothetical protein EDD85DRAFT_949472 [Armillaria nabsnona]|nr:hypothetical protein EDD85DRAFT_949472 [Armillaria nabsnona]